MSKMPEIRLQSTRAALLATGTIAVMLLASCAAPRPAPVSDARPPVAKTEAAAPAATDATKSAEPLRVHMVQRGETLYSIAFQNGIDIRELAAWNNIVNPAVIRVGDTIRLTSPDAAPAATPAGPQPGMAVATPLVFTPAVAPGPAGAANTSAPPQAAPTTAPGAATENTATMKVEPKAGRVPYTDAAYAKMNAEAAPAGAVNNVPAVVPSTSTTPAAPVAAPAGAGGGEAVAWSWPVKGKVVSNFTDLSKGIDIAGSKGTPVFAAAPGKVIHSGSVIRGYGRLIIIKHNDSWLSAYAHNEKLLVNEGDDVKKGQKIAEMGSSDTDAVKLHFEIRSKGKPVDPLKFLPAQ